MGGGGVCPHTPHPNRHVQVWAGTWACNDFLKFSYQEHKRLGILPVQDPPHPHKAPPRLWAAYGLTAEGKRPTNGAEAAAVAATAAEPGLAGAEGGRQGGAGRRRKSARQGTRKGVQKAAWKPALMSELAKQRLKEALAASGAVARETLFDDDRLVITA